MAKVGLEYVCFAPINTESQTEITYKAGKYLGPSTSLTGNPTRNTVTDYGDNYAVETDTSVTGGDLSLELNEEPLEISAFLLGHKFDESSNELVYNSNDVAPMGGLGYIGMTKRNNVTMYVAKFYAKTQFTEANDENTTKGETIEFNHSNLEGRIHMPATGNWKFAEEFTTREEAMAWVRAKCNISD